MIEPETIIDGRYRVISRVGSGGMADVYLAQDQLLGREVAVKVLHQHFAEDQEFVERFRREASSAAALSHPNIVGIFDRGEWNGTYYIAMEYVAGRTLKSIVREEGALDPSQAIDIVVQILRAAQFAHRRGVIHRDLKPHNVILDEEGRVRVTDFGIARAGASDMTLTGSIMGTAQYLSPEQAQGYSVSETSDIYSVGVILYELLTGAVPFEGESAVAIAFKQVSAEPRPPSELNPSLPPGLDAIVLRALAKDPAQRYANAGELIAALEHERQSLPALSGAALGAHGNGPPGRAPGNRPGAGALLLAADRRPGDGYEPPPDEDHRLRRGLLWVLAGLLLAGLVALALVLLLPSSTTVRVPNVVGQTEQSAAAALRRAGLNAAPSLAPSTTVATGLVIRERPAAGALVKKGARVSIVVSAGPASAALPDVEGLSAGAAVAKLRKEGFKPSTKTQPSTTVPAGKVIGTNPPAGTELQLGSSVSVLVSSGPEAVHVPDVVGQSLSEGEATLTNAGLAVGTVTQKVSTTQSPGTVLSQSPPTGSSAHAGDKVNLTVAQASTEAQVPSVVGKSEALAAAALGEAGFTPKTVPATTAEPAQVGVVLKQQPAPGTRARKGSSVTIAVGVLGTQTTPTTPPTTTPPATTPTTTPPPPAAG
jgi:eukaryotic-like serine/threonine-protein kinase